MIIIVIFIAMCSIFFQNAQANALLLAQYEKSDHYNLERLSITEGEMLQRLVDLAEGVMPLRSHLENEFKFKFKLLRSNNGNSIYFGQAAHPFGNKSDNFGCYEFTESSSIVLLFGEDNDADISRRFCLDTAGFEKKLSSAWKKEKVVRGHASLELVYTAIFMGMKRELIIAPPYMGSAACMNFFSINFFSKK